MATSSSDTPIEYAAKVTSFRELPIADLAIERFQSSSLYGDYAAVAAALGCHAEQVSRLADLRPALERGIRAVREGRPAVVDVITAETRRLSTPPPERS